METYIVRIYRCTKGEEVVGIVEHVDTQMRFRFQTILELCEIISDPKIKGKQKRGGKVLPKHPGMALVTSGDQGVSGEGKT